LTECEAIAVAANLDAQKEVEGTEVFDCEGLTELVDDLTQQGCCRGSEDYVIHIDEEVCRLPTVTEDKQGAV
jgi:hypothetical protein